MLKCFEKKIYVGDKEMIELHLKVDGHKIHVKYHDTDVMLSEAGLFILQLEKVKEEILALDFETVLNIRHEVPLEEEDENGDDE